MNIIGGGDDELIKLVRDHELKSHVAEIILPSLPVLSLATSSQAHTGLTLAASLPSALSFSAAPTAAAAAAAGGTTGSAIDSRSSSSAFRNVWAAFPAPSQFIGTTLSFITFHIKNVATVTLTLFRHIVASFVLVCSNSLCDSYHERSQLKWKLWTIVACCETFKYLMHRYVRIYAALQA
jgi:hypothetical protein